MKRLAFEQRMELLRAVNDPIQHARLVVSTWLESGLTQEEFGRRIGCSQSQIAALRRLLRLHPKWRERIRRRQISATHADTLLRHENNPTVLAIVEDRYFRRGHRPAPLPHWKKFDREVAEIEKAVVAG
jgi:ParB-like chromosome segregation protein Spo0J